MGVSVDDIAGTRLAQHFDTNAVAFEYRLNITHSGNLVLPYLGTN